MAAMVATIVIDNTKQLFAQLMAALSPQRVNRRVGEAATYKVKKHFANLDQTRPNKLGGDRTHFYEQAADRTDFDFDDAAAIISIAKLGIAQRRYGGTITAGKSISDVTGDAVKYLTIPAAAEAYGHSAGYFGDNLAIVFGQGGIPRALAEVAQTHSEKTGKPFKNPKPGGKIMYWLVESVTQQPDPSVLPTDAEIKQAVTDALKLHFADLSNE